MLGQRAEWPGSWWLTWKGRNKGCLNFRTQKSTESLLNLDDIRPLKYETYTLPYLSCIIQCCRPIQNQYLSFLLVTQEVFGEDKDGGTSLSVTVLSAAAAVGHLLRRKLSETCWVEWGKGWDWSCTFRHWPYNHPPFTCVLVHMCEINHASNDQLFCKTEAVYKQRVQLPTSVGSGLFPSSIKTHCCITLWERQRVNWRCSC